MPAEYEVFEVDGHEIRLSNPGKVYFPQSGWTKGDLARYHLECADAELVKRLAERLDQLAGTFPRDPRGVPMTGAAGGLSGGLWAVHGAQLEPGAPFILDTLDFDARMRASRAVVTGEGKLDEQTLQGKLVGEIGTRARQAGVPLHAFVGRDELDAFGKRIIDLQVVRETTTQAELEAAAEELGGDLLTGAA